MASNKENTKFVDARMSPGGVLNFGGMSHWKAGEESRTDAYEIFNMSTAQKLAIGEEKLTTVYDAAGKTIGLTIEGLSLSENSVDDEYNITFAEGLPDTELMMLNRANMGTKSQQLGQANALGRGGAIFMNSDSGLIDGPFFNVVVLSNNTMFSNETIMQAGSAPPSNLTFIAGFSFMLPFSKIKLVNGNLMCYNG